MKNLKIMFGLLTVIGLFGIAEASACRFPAENFKAAVAPSIVPPETYKDIVFRDEGDQKLYNRSDLRGRYSSFSQATLYDPTLNRTSFATCVGVVTFDGRGRFTDREVHSYDGVIVRDQFTGTYTVNPDGTGTMHFNGSESFDYDIVLSNEGKDVIFLVELPVPGLVSQGTLKKQ
ncbi:MAG: hypothetical protein JSS81_29030 [Acidobacteria bacterium]|nr:hypothetical protein [Acidobacteriota bacterium]